MHELSIALNLVELAEEEARKAGCSKVYSVEVALGLLSGVDPDALAFSINLAKESTMLCDAAINLHTVEGNGRCRMCDHVFPVSTVYSICPECNSNAVEIVTGDELKLLSLQAE